MPEIELHTLFALDFSAASGLLLVGGVVHVIADNGRAVHLKPDLKAEGLCWWKTENGLDRWLLVADADDPAQRPPLFAFATAA